MGIGGMGWQKQGFTGHTNAVPAWVEQSHEAQRQESQWKKAFDRLRDEVSFQTIYSALTTSKVTPSYLLKLWSCFRSSEGPDLTLSLQWQRMYSSLTSHTVQRWGCAIPCPDASHNSHQGQQEPLDPTIPSLVLQTSSLPICLQGPLRRAGSQARRGAPTIPFLCFWGVCLILISCVKLSKKDPSAAVVMWMVAIPTHYHATCCHSCRRRKPGNLN